jgi:hypothetical protein
MSGDFERLADLIRLVTDGKACAKRAEELVGLTTAAIEAKAEAEAAQAALAAAKAAQEAELAEREQELNEFAERLREREQAVVNARETVLGGLAHMRGLDKQMKCAVMNYAGVLDSFNERLQDLPSWESLNRDMLGQDPHFDGAEPARVAQETENEPVPNRVAGSNLTRSIERRSMRRVSAE